MEGEVPQGRADRGPWRWAVREVTLENRDGLHIGASLRGDDGALVIRGEVDRQSPWGAEKYSYRLVVAPCDVPRVMAALGAPTEGVDVLDVLLAHKSDLIAPGERAWLRSIGIEPAYEATENDD